MSYVAKALEKLSSQIAELDFFTKLMLLMCVEEVVRRFFFRFFKSCVFILKIINNICVRIDIKFFIFRTNKISQFYVWKIPFIIFELKHGNSFFLREKIVNFFFVINHLS